MARLDLEQLAMEHAALLAQASVLAARPYAPGDSRSAAFNPEIRVRGRLADGDFFASEGAYEGPASVADVL